MQIDRPIAIAIIIFIIILLVFFLVMPEYKTFGKLQADLGEKKAEFNAEFDYYAAITKTYFDLQGRQDDIAKVDDALPPKPDIGKIIYFLQEVAMENGMMVKDLALARSSATNAATSAGNNIKEIVFSINLLGDYPSLDKFIIAMEKSSRLIEITNISFGSALGGATGSSQPQLQTQRTYSFNLQIKTHSY